jgi:hypothetical protein
MPEGYDSRIPHDDIEPEHDDGRGRDLREQAQLTGRDHPQRGRNERYGQFDGHKAP